MSLRAEFVQLARQPEVNIRELCRRYSISPKTAYKWLARYDAAEGDAQSLSDHSRKPLHSPHRSTADIEGAVVWLRSQHPTWGGRKIARRLLDTRGLEVAPSTVTSILHRHGLITAECSERAGPFTRFEHEQPNSLWQMDFKGTFGTLAGHCYPLTVLDDHSRFNLALEANERTTTEEVRSQLQRIFERYGLPARINTDNGPPWGAPYAPGQAITQLGAWLIRLGVTVSHSRPHHPQTNGKIERFHRTLEQEVLRGEIFADHAHVQRRFDRWRNVYNLHRPHEGLALSTPAQRYTPSPIRMPQRLPPVEYASTDIVVRVTATGVLNYRGRKLVISRALAKSDVALRADSQRDGLLDVMFCHQKVATLDLNSLPVDT